MLSIELPSFSMLMTISEASELAIRFISCLQSRCSASAAIVTRADALRCFFSNDQDLCDAQVPSPSKQTCTAVLVRAISNQIWPQLHNLLLEFQGAFSESIQLNVQVAWPSSGGFATSPGWVSDPVLSALMTAGLRHCQILRARLPANAIVVIVDFQGLYGFFSEAFDLECSDPSPPRDACRVELSWTDMQVVRKEQLRRLEQSRMELQQQIEKVASESRRQLEQSRMELKQRVEKVALESRQQLQCEVLRRMSLLPSFLDRQQREQTVPRTDAVYDFVVGLMRTSCVSHRLNIRSEVMCDPPGLEVLDVLQLTNGAFLQKYSAERSLIAERVADGCSAVAGLEPMLPQVGISNLNEALLCHGAPADTIQKIISSGFDPRRGGEYTGQLFGHGTYFAQNSSKCCLYNELSRTDGIPFRSESPWKMLLCRVLLGQTLRTDQSCRGIRKPPDQEDGTPYDSITALTRQEGGIVDMQEYVVFKEAHALPMFLVSYRHSSTCECHLCRGGAF